MTIQVDTAAGSDVPVHVISLGGTIAMTHTNHGAVPTLTGADLLGVGAHAHPRLTFASAAEVPSASLQPHQLHDVLIAAEAAISGGAQGVVVTQGTDTIEETSFFMDLRWTRDEPIVLTGAMRPASAPGADGPANLAAAVTVAASPAARGRGALVVFGDEIHAARYVSKVHSSRLAAFTSPLTGPVGAVTENEARFWSAPSIRFAQAAPMQEQRVRVLLITAVLGDGDEMLRYAIEDPAVSGVVIAAMGGGHIPEWWLAAMEELVARVPVVVATRTGAGLVLAGSYGFRGSERDLHRMGLLNAGDVSPLKARILLTHVLESASSRADAEEAFLSIVNTPDTARKPSR